MTGQYLAYTSFSGMNYILQPLLFNRLQTRKDRLYVRLKLVIRSIWHLKYKCFFIQLQISWKFCIALKYLRLFRSLFRQELINAVRIKLRQAFPLPREVSSLLRSDKLWIIIATVAKKTHWVLNGFTSACHPEKKEPFPWVTLVCRRSALSQRLIPSLFSFTWFCYFIADRVLLNPKGLQLTTFRRRVKIEEQP